jgi:rhodanese-related sulfurtransferase
MGMPVDNQEGGTMAKQTRHLFSMVSLIGLLMVFSGRLAADDEFPGREKFPDVPYITLNELFAQKTDVAIVDVRSQYEFQTLRIRGAINIPVANKSFEDQVAKLRQSTGKQIVCYCNGHRCMKSYQAVKKAQAVGIDNIIAYDGGIFDWTKAYPDQAVLLGQSPVDPDRLISQKAFQSRLLHPDLFSESIARSRHTSVVIDVRDKFQRAGIGFYPGLEKWASLDDRRKLHRYIERAKYENKTLYIYDEVGKQVRWLQYALEKAGIKNYYFMEKGARAYYDMIAEIEWQ